MVIWGTKVVEHLRCVYHVYMDHELFLLLYWGVLAVLTNRYAVPYDDMYQKRVESTDLPRTE